MPPLEEAPSLGGQSVGSMVRRKNKCFEYLYEGQDYGGFLWSNSCHLGVAVYPWFDGMLQNIWDARMLTGGVSTQREPMSTELMPLTPSNPSGPHLLQPLCPCSRSRHWVHCRPPPSPTGRHRALTDSQRCQRYERKIPRKQHSHFMCWPGPFFSAHRCLFVTMTRGDRG